MIEGILTTEERTELIPTVAVFISGNPVRLTTVIPQAHFIRIPTDPIPEQYAYSVIYYCEMSAWMEDPALIIQLLSKWSTLPTFDAAINRIKASKPASFHIPPRVWDPILVNLNLPLLNRAITREAIECFYYPLIPTIKPAGIRVLVVTGPSGSGKSFTYLYIHYIKLFLTDMNFRPVYIDIKVQASSRFGPLDLARTLLDQVNPNWINEGIVLPELKEEQSSRWINQLCNIITEQIAFIGKKCIIVLDGLKTKENTQPIPGETVDMILALAAIATGEELPEESNDLIRLVLLGFEKPVKNFRNRVRVDKINPLTAADIEKYFTDYARFYNKIIDPAGMTDMINVVLDQDVAEDPDRTRKLAQKALTVAIGIINS